MIPRAALFGYAYFVWHTTNYIMVWYTHEPAAARGVEESGTVAAIFAIVTGLAPWIYKIYSDAGRDWNDQPVSSTTSTVVATKETVTK